MSVILGQLLLLLANSKNMMMARRREIGTNIPVCKPNSLQPGDAYVE